MAKDLAALTNGPIYPNESRRTKQVKPSKTDQARQTKQDRPSKTDQVRQTKPCRRPENILPARITTSKAPSRGNSALQSLKKERLESQINMFQKYFSGKNPIKTGLAGDLKRNIRKKETKKADQLKKCAIVAGSAFEKQRKRSALKAGKTPRFDRL
jgi:hypothetical protein